MSDFRPGDLVQCLADWSGSLYVPGVGTVSGVIRAGESATVLDLDRRIMRVRTHRVERTELWTHFAPWRLLSALEALAVLGQPGSL